jgi:hypothetical protein
VFVLVLLQVTLVISIDSSAPTITTNLQILLYYVFVTRLALQNSVHAFPLGAQVFLAGLLRASRDRAVYQLRLAILVDMQLDVSARHDFLAALVGIRTADSDIVAHVDQQPRNIAEYLAGVRAA